MNKSIIRKYKKITLVLVGIFLIICGVCLNPHLILHQEATALYQPNEPIPEGIPSHGEYSASTYLPQEKQPYKPHAPINITSDEDFVMYGFNGTGTEDAPYLIEELNITTNQRNAVYIANTTVHFVISDCYLQTQTARHSDYDYHGIHLNNITKGSAYITNNTIIGNVRGITVWHSHIEIRIVNNVIDENIDAIRCVSVDSVFVFDNMITHSFAGIYIEWFTILIINNNTITDSEAGILISDGESVTITHNFLHVEIAGIESAYCLFIAITNNVVIGGWISWSSYVLYEHMSITNNTIINSHDRGIMLGINEGGKTPVIAYNNILSNTKYGLKLDNTANTIIYANNFIGNGGENSQGHEYVFKEVDQNNSWYNETVQEGNYWSDYDGKGTYAIDGNIGSKDLYPLDAVIDSILSTMDYTPEMPVLGDEITIAVTIKDPITVDQVVLMHRVIGEQDAWQHSPMSGDGNAYSVTLGPFPERSIILYYVSVVDTTGRIFDSSVFGFVIRPKGLFPFRIPFTSFVFILLYLGVAALPYTYKKIRKRFSCSFF